MKSVPPRLDCALGLFRAAVATDNLFRSLRHRTRTHGLMALGLGALATGGVRAGTLSISQVNPLPGHPSSSLIYQASGTNYASFPFAMVFDVNNAGTTQRKVIAQWQFTADGGSSFIARRATSSDGGVTFGAIEGSDTEPVTLINPIKKRDGTIIALPFSLSNSFNYYTANGDGTGWIKHTDGTANVALLMHRGVIEENDGTLWAVGYNGAGVVKLFKSAPASGGKDWTFVKVIANGGASGDGHNYNEACIARCRDGSWLVVIRTEAEAARFVRSSDQGVTWTSPAIVPGLPSNPIVDPSLTLMPNGILVLSYGQVRLPIVHGRTRDIRIAFSADGNGASWTQDQATFTGTEGTKESTGYTTALAVGPTRLLQVGDTGTSWSYTPAFPPPTPYTTWGQFIDVVPDLVNRIDLKGRVAAGTATITTDLTYSASAHPEARASGAYDGSTEYWSGAFKSGTSGSYQIDLQSVQRIAALGVCLHYNTSESATVSFSQDGANWGNPVKVYSNAAHRALDYTKFDVPILARYVSVALTGAGPLVSLNEIELYGTKDTFENNAIGDPGNPHGILPAGYAWNGTSSTQYGFAVRDSLTSTAGYQSERSLQMWDGSSTWRAGIKKVVETTPTKTLEFRVKPLSYATSGGVIQFSLGSGAANVFQMGVFPDGSVKYYNGSAWVSTTGTGSPAGAGTVPLNAWSLIRVDAVAWNSAAALYINGVLKGTAGKIGTAMTMDSFAFGSGGTGPWNDNALFDDVSCIEFASFLHNYESDTVGAVPAGYDAGAVLSTVSNTRAHGGTRSLRVYDNSASQIASIARTVEAADRKSLDFWLWPAAVASAIDFNILGQVTSGTNVIFHLAVFADGSVHYHDGANWQQVPGCPAGTVPINSAWTRIHVEANTSAAHVYVNNNWKGAVSTYANAANVLKLNGFSFTSGGTPTAGDDGYFDDVYFGR